MILRRENQAEESSQPFTEEGSRIMEIEVCGVSRPVDFVIVYRDGGGQFRTEDGETVVLDPIEIARAYRAKMEDGRSAYMIEDYSGEAQIVTTQAEKIREAALLWVLGARTFQTFPVDPSWQKRNGEGLKNPFLRGEVW